ncbi:MAG: fatty acid desaturase [Phenylobacterium sp.]|uniref:Fatty acid desaturase n=1 Tax=Phenylobacterium ferrooxidans TaxID=2982689 RepID=A0ABW6CRS9_9CAUL|nr:fatty acid desaturase [Phenylobacterium sp.]
MPNPDTRPWRQRLAPYQQPSARRSILEIVITAAPLAAIWAVAWVAAHFGLWWVALLLAVPAALFLVRLFMVQHDCSHRAFFRNRHANDWIGRVIGVLTVTPYDCWRQTHAIHHATSGDLDRRGLGDILTLTVEEYRALPLWRRIGYRLYRHPVVLFGIGPAYVFLLEQRLPSGLMKGGWRPWLSAMGTNAGIAVFLVIVALLAGWQALLLVNLPTLVIASSIGVWLFYVQHQFEGTYWARRDDWDLTEAALKGASHYHLPQPLRWMTANIGVHHVHHIASRIPFYRLPTVLKDHPELREAARLSVPQSIRAVPLSLWDEASEQLISFRQLARQTRAAAAA